MTVSAINSHVFVQYTRHQQQNLHTLEDPAVQLSFWTGHAISAVHQIPRLFHEMHPAPDASAAAPAVSCTTSTALIHLSQMTVWRIHLSLIFSNDKTTSRWQASWECLGQGKHAHMHTHTHVCTGEDNRKHTASDLICGSTKTAAQAKNNKTY